MRTKQFSNLVFIFFLFLVLNSCSNELTEQNNHKLSSVIDGFHLYSYYAGSAFTASEFVSAGCKKIAISPTYTEKELNVMLEPSKMAADEYNIPYYVEREFLTTKLFSPSLTEGKIVILFAQNQTVLEEYFALKKEKKEAIENGILQDLEDDIAWKFGKLLSYSDEKIKELMTEEKG